MPSESDAERARADAMKRLEATHEADPRTSPFGYFSGDDWEGGAGMFHWFESEDALMRGITQDLPSAVGDLDEDELEEYRTELASVLQTFPPGKRLGSKCFSALQDALSGFQSLEWMGTFTDLCKSMDGWSSKVRADFRAMSDDDDCEAEDEDLAQSARPIESDEVDEFIAYVHAYGF